MPVTQLAPVLIADSITRVGDEAAGAVVVNGSHGGIYAAYVAAKLRVAAAVFNDAGVGRDQAGIAGLDYLADNYPSLSITLCGFSFGARVGLDVGIKDDRVKYLIGIGTPLDKYDFDFLQSCRKPLLLVHGEHDEFGNVERVRQLAAELEKHTQVSLVVIPGADHFFENRLDELKQAVTDWITKQLGG